MLPSPDSKTTKLNADRRQARSSHPAGRRNLLYPTYDIFHSGSIILALLPAVLYQLPRLVTHGGQVEFGGTFPLDNSSHDLYVVNPFKRQLVEVNLDKSLGNCYP